MTSSEEIIDKIRRAQENPEPTPEVDAFIEKKKEFAIDDSIDYPDPEYLVEIGNTPTMPKGNIVALSAKWKNGKTFFCDIVSAVFLGCDTFASCRPLFESGKVQFFDTEQAVSDTARIRKTIKALIPEGREDDLEVYCLRNAVIENEGDEENEISRFDFISKAISIDKPDLVIIDGIADLIYNYNDVIESQSMVNKIAAMANEHNCCIVVVMHQNKGQKDKNMKGHLGTMLFQKCSDVFNVEKCGNLFVVNHAVSRHRSCDDIVFKLDANAIPVDAVADRALQLEIEESTEISKTRESIQIIFEDAENAMTRQEIVIALINNLGMSKSKAYRIFNYAKDKNIILSNDHKHFYVPPNIFA